MCDIDSVVINFSQDQKLLMNFCLGFIMFGVALSITMDDFKRIIRFPKSVIVGISSEWLVMPILTVYLIHLWKPSCPSVAMGMLLVAACPGGPLSNFMTQLSKGNAALSLTLTSIFTACSIIITPYTFLGFAYFVPEASAMLAKINMKPGDMLVPLISILLIPVTFGMLTNHYRPVFTSKIIKTVKRISMVIFISFIVVAIVDNTEALVKYVQLVFMMVLIQNMVGMAAGYYWAKWHRLSVPDRKAISFETGIHNSGLGLVLVFNFFPTLGGMMLIVAVWAIWDMISSLFVALYWSRTTRT
jgi:bile acid:Na+ symporter, BASS family